MEIDELAIKLDQHEARSQERYEYTVECLKKHHHKEMEAIETIEAEEAEEVTTMTQPINIFDGQGGMGGAGAGLGAGLGGGLLGGILGGALLGGNGFGNRGNFVGEGVVTPMQLQTATGSIIDASQNTAVLQGLGDIKAAVPLAEAQAQLAIAQSQAAISNQIGQSQNAVLGGQAVINKNVADAIAASLASQNNININVLTQGSATREAVNAMGVANLTATANSTREILAALTAQNEAGLRSEITALQIRLGETQNEARARGTEVTVTQTVNQNQLQLQAQQQQQQQAILLNNLCAVVGGLQNAVATNSNLIVGNAGAVTTGTQTSNPVNVKA